MTTKTEKMQLVRHLDDTIQLFDKMKWIQRSLEERARDGTVIGVCMLGAIDYAESTYGQLQLTVSSVEETIKRKVGSAKSIAYFNDRIAKSKDEVIAIFKVTRRRINDQLKRI